jgi:hypothetical protein
MIALIIALAVLALGWMVAGVGATPAGQTSAEETRLQFSHMCITQNAQAEVHFVLIDPPQNVTNWGAVAYTMTVPTGQTVSREAPFDRVTGNAAHYLDLAPSGGPGEYVFVEGHVIVDGARYDLANPGPRQVGYCSPTSIEVRAFVVESTKLDNPMLPLVVAAIAVIVLVGVLLKVLKVGQSH